MEDDRDGRERRYARITPERVLEDLRAHVAGGDVMFTSGEPTLNKNLPIYFRWARQLGYRTIGLTTNARRLGYEPYARQLVAEGLNLVVVSIHGHDAKLHDGQTRTPGSFAQTCAGLETLARIKAELPVRVHTSTVVGRRNYRHFGDIYRMLTPYAIDEYVFNVMQPLGRGSKLRGQLVARYRDIVASFQEFLDAVGRTRAPVYLVDLPPCTTESLPDAVRGYVELAKFHEYQLDGQAKLRASRETKEVKNRGKRAECAACDYDPVCLGAWRNYTEVYGWDELIPVKGARLLRAGPPVTG
jgi:MoaA/NifB/PqqE/SkfB family radical SAM enzyme